MLRQNLASYLKDEFKLGAPLVHWDRKLMKDLNSKKTGWLTPNPDIRKEHYSVTTYSIVKLGSGTGDNMANAVVVAVERCNHLDQVVGMSFDIIALNSGWHKGLNTGRTKTAKIFSSMLISHPRDDPEKCLHSIWSFVC